MGPHGSMPASTNMHHFKLTLGFVGMVLASVRGDGDERR